MVPRACGAKSEVRTMNPKTLDVLEFNKIRGKLVEHCAFSGGADLALALLPSDDLETVRERLAQTGEAYKLLEQKTDITFGGVKDMRPVLEKAERGVTMMPLDLLDVKNTLLRARSLRNLLTRLEHSFPRLADMAYNIEPCDHVIAEVGRCINDRAEVVDAASSELAQRRSGYSGGNASDCASTGAAFCQAKPLRRERLRRAPRPSELAPA